MMNHVKTELFRKLLWTSWRYVPQESIVGDQGYEVSGCMPSQKWWWAGTVLLHPKY